MSEFHTNLKTSLDRDDEAFLKTLNEEPGLFAQLGNTFHGKLKFWTAYAVIMSLVIFAGSVYCFVQLLGTESIRESILWATGVWTGMLSVGLIKIWFWMRMNHLAVLREMKKLELYVVKGAE